MGWVPLVMFISISNKEELYYSTNRTTIVATIVLTIVPIEVGQCLHGKANTYFRKIKTDEKNGDRLFF